MWVKRHHRKKENEQKLQYDFLSDMSYNIRNPLNAIMGMTDIALKSIQTGNNLEQLQSYLEIVKDSSKELQEVIDKCFEKYEIKQVEASGQQNEETGKTPSEILKNLRILIIEDNNVNQMITKELLEANGAIVTLANDGEEGYALFADSITGTFDIIFMDIKMPRLNGYDATRKIRSCEHPQAKSIPIIALTADVFAEDIQNALNAGMNAHIGKPIDLEKVISTVENVSKNKKI